MKIGYAFRRNTFYPFPGSAAGNDLPPREYLVPFLKRVRQAGFEGIEVGLERQMEDESYVRELRRILEGEGVPAAVIRGGGGFASPRNARGARQRFEQAVRAAALIGCNLVNSTVGVGIPNRYLPGAGAVGERHSHGSSQMASHTDFQITADHLRGVADVAAGMGVEIAIEMHQHSLADNSWSCLHLLDLVDRPNVGVNPDLGNLYWNYEVPEESSEACIKALAPRAKYWHCKQLYRVHVPDVGKAYFLKVPLPDGELDYRFAISAMVEAGYPGFLAVEGCREGDQLYRDKKSVDYCREILRDLGQ